jgi:hypothetical protein
LEQVLTLYIDLSSLSAKSSKTTICEITECHVHHHCIQTALLLVKEIAEKERIWVQAHGIHQSSHHPKAAGLIEEWSV